MYDNNFLKNGLVHSFEVIFITVLAKALEKNVNEDFI